MLDLELRAVTPEDVVQAIDEDVAVVTLSHVDYRSGARFDLPAISAAAKAADALNLWDLSHSAGAVALDLSASGCDLAVGCGYKYLNGGPGAPAFVYVAERLQDALRPPLQGWMGHAEPFALEFDYRPAPGIARFRTGTPPILSLAALDAGLETFEGIGMGDIEAKAAALSDMFIADVEARCGGELTPCQPARSSRRGSHVSFAHASGYAVMRALIDRGIIGDFRCTRSAALRLCPALQRALPMSSRRPKRCESVLQTGDWDQPRFHERLRVT